MKLQAVEADKGQGECGPFAMYFPNGRKDDDDRNCTWEIQRNSDAVLDTYLIGRTEHVDFVGHARGTSAEHAPCRFAVGVIDKSSGVMKYSMVEQSQIFRVEPQAHAIDFKTIEGNALEEKLDREQRYAHNRRLVDAFGSTRRKRQLNTRQGAAIKEDAVGGAEALRSFIQTAGDKAVDGNLTKKAVMERALGFKNLPPHNPAAITPQEAYRLSDLVPAQLESALEAENLDKFSQESDETNAMLEYIRVGLIRHSLSGKTPSEKWKNGVIYLHGLFQLRSMKSVDSHPNRGGIQQVAEKMDLKVEVLQAILNEFYTENKKGQKIEYSRTDTQSNLLTLHILILALTLEGYTLGASHCEMLRQALKMAPSTFAQMYRELGCVVRTSSRKSQLENSSPTKELTVILLPATTPPKPLGEYFPQIKTGGKRGR